jgi:hypothetical protein
VPRSFNQLPLIVPLSRQRAAAPRRLELGQHLLLMMGDLALVQLGIIEIIGERPATVIPAETK